MKILFENICMETLFIMQDISYAVSKMNTPIF